MGPAKFLCYTLVLVTAALTTTVNSEDKTGCVFPKHLADKSKKGEGQIEILKGNRYQVSDEEYTYHIGICADAINPIPEGSESLKGAGVVQIKKSDSKSTIIGKYTVSDIVAGPEWVMLEYNGGATYNSHCIAADDSKEKRRARIMFICDMTAPEEAPVILEEQNNKTDACYYLFEISTATVCPKQPLVTFGLSVGSVLLIVFFCVLGVYLIGGCLYNRFVLGAKGLEQVPNQTFWEDFGNLQADGCDLVCRSRRSKQPKTYKGIGDDQLQEVEERTDDHLLPM